MGVHYQISQDKALHMTDLMTENVSLCLSVCLPFITCSRCQRHSSETAGKVGTSSGAGMALFVHFVFVPQESLPDFGSFAYSISI